MSASPMTALLNDFSEILSTTPTEDTVNRLVRHASAQLPATAMLALCSLFMIENARRFHAEERYRELLAEMERKEAQFKKALERQD